MLERHPSNSDTHWNPWRTYQHQQKYHGPPHPGLIHLPCQFAFPCFIKSVSHAWMTLSILGVGSGGLKHPKESESHGWPLSEWERMEPLFLALGSGFDGKLISLPRRSGPSSCSPQELSPPLRPGSSGLWVFPLSGCPLDWVPDWDLPGHRRHSPATSLLVTLCSHLGPLSVLPVPLIP